jgi:hypothetical protein
VTSSSSLVKTLAVLSMLLSTVSSTKSKTYISPPLIV